MVSRNLSQNLSHSEELVEMMQRVVGSEALGENQVEVSSH